MEKQYKHQKGILLKENTIQRPKEKMTTIKKWPKGITRKCTIKHKEERKMQSIKKSEVKYNFYKWKYDR